MKILAFVLCPALLAMASLTQAASFTVNATGDQVDADDGVTTLREAVVLANADSDATSDIDFDLGSDGAEIRLNDVLSLDQPTTIDGRGQITLTLQHPPTASAAGIPICLECPIDIDLTPPRLFQVSAQAAGTVLSGLDLRAGDAGRLLDAGGDLSLTSSRVTGFPQVVAITGDAVQLEIDHSVLTENGAILDASVGNAGGTTALTGGTLTLRNSLLDGNGRVSALQNDSADPTPFTLTLKNTRLTGQDGGRGFLLRGAIALVLDHATLDHNTPQSLISATTDGLGNTPQVVIANSTLSGNRWTATEPFIAADGPGLSVRHSTLTGNASDAGQALIDAVDLVVHDSVVTGNPGVSRDLDGSGESRYSLVDTRAVAVTAANEVVGGARLGPLTFRNATSGSHLPDPLSPLIGAGDPALVAGSGDTPARDQRGSERVIGGVIDIGAVEFNREPEVDLAALKQAFREETGEALNIRRVSTDSEIFPPFLDIILDPDLIIDGGAGGGVNIGIVGLDPHFGMPISGAMTVSAATVASGLIYVDLDNYISDPDGDLIDRIQLSWSARQIFELDLSTRQLSGTLEDFLNHPVALALRDEHGLVATHAFQVLPATPEQDSGGAGFGLLLLVALGWLRRRD